MMPVRSFDWDFDNIFGLQEDPLFQMEQTLGPDFYSLLPSEDIWKKFEITDGGMMFDFRASDMYMTDDDAGDATEATTPGGAEQRRITGSPKEIRHHDCMWAGRCGSKDHKTVEKEEDKTTTTTDEASSVRPTARKTARGATKKDQQVVEDKLVVVSTNGASCPANANRTLKQSVTVLKSASILKTGLTLNVTNKINNSTMNSGVNACVKSTNAGRSLLRTPVKNTAYVAPPVLPDYALESDGDSPRPDTPSSESEDDDDDDDFDFKHNLDLSSSVAAVCATDDVLNYDDYRTQVDGDCTSSSDDSDFDSVLLPHRRTAVAVSEVTGQNLKPPAAVVGGGGDAPVKQEEYINSDHCYHLNKTVHLDSLGVQTPSDSEEEIDVVSFYDSEAQPTSRSSSCGGTSLPTNPSDRDRQQLQLAVKSAITKKQSEPPATAPATPTTPIRIALGGKIMLDMRTLGAEMAQAHKTNRKTKRSAAFSCSEDEDERTIFKKGVKRMKRQYHHRMQHHTMRPKKAGSTGSSSPRSGSGSSEGDSEPESLEKRSMHNNMERQRRIDLRNLVEGLRALVPNVETKSRAAKVLILKEASAYCQDLTEEYEEKTAEAAALRLKQYKLRQKLSQLRRACANLR